VDDNFADYFGSRWHYYLSGIIQADTKLRNPLIFSVGMTADDSRKQY